MRVDRPAYIRRPASDVRSKKDSDFPEWLQSRTCYGDATISNVIINVGIRYGNLAHINDGYRQQLCIHNCDQTAAHRDTVTIDSIRTLCRLIQRYHRRPPTTYGLATISHNWHNRVRNGHSRSSNFCFIWKGLFVFLLVIDSNLGPISHRFWDTTSYRLKTHIFPAPFLFSSKFKNVPFELDRYNVACEDPWHRSI